MSVEIWPPIAPEKLKIAVVETQRRELEWLLDELHETLRELKHGLEDCYALLAPVDPGSTLVLTTPRNEAVKGTITRVGTRIVKGTIHLRLKTLPPQTLTIAPERPIHLAPLTILHTLLTNSVDLLTLTLSYSYPNGPDSSDADTNKNHSVTSSSHHRMNRSLGSAAFIAAQLRLLASSLAEANALLKGPPLAAPADATWTTRSASASHFTPPLGPALSFHLGVQDGGLLVLWLRALEPADVPVNFGTKLALAIGTTRRLDHDEADRVFSYWYGAGASAHAHDMVSHMAGETDSGKEEDRGGGSDQHTAIAPPPPTAASPLGERKSSVTSTGGHTGEHPPVTPAGAGRREMDVYVREKVRVESADPSLLALSAKLGALCHALAMARRNLAAVMGEELED